MSEMIGDLHGKVILITGGAQGIGGATAQLCAQRGARVIVVDVKPSGEESAAAIRAAGGDAVFRQVDVRNHDQVRTVPGHDRSLPGMLARLDGKQLFSRVRTEVAFHV